MMSIKLFSSIVRIVTLANITDQCLNYWPEKTLREINKFSIVG
jgi:hypothetical protein